MEKMQPSTSSAGLKRRSSIDSNPGNKKIKLEDVELISTNMVDIGQAQIQNANRTLSPLSMINRHMEIQLHEPNELYNVHDYPADYTESTDRMIQAIENRWNRKTPSHLPETKIKINIAREHLIDYGPQLKYAYKMWNRYSKILKRVVDENFKITVNPLLWTVDEVCSYGKLINLLIHTYQVNFILFISVMKLPQCASAGNMFQTEQIDGAAFLNLCQEDLINCLHIKVGPAIKIYNRILYLREEVMMNFLTYGEEKTIVCS